MLYILPQVHAEIRYNSKEHIYTIQDKGSQNGTYVNEERLSEVKYATRAGLELTTLVVISTEYISGSNYHMITTTTSLVDIVVYCEL
jgi:pSer/pThr/pTyr-binding forkhead associated (FHA) protein